MTKCKCKCRGNRTSELTKRGNRIQLNSIWFNLYRSKTIQLSQGALQSPEGGHLHGPGRDRGGHLHGSGREVEIEGTICMGQVERKRGRYRGSQIHSHGEIERKRSCEP